MTEKIKLKILALCCILLLAGLSYIQYDLIRNTFRLTKANYINEVNGTMLKLINGRVLTAESNKGLKNFAGEAAKYIDHTITREELWHQLVTDTQNDAEKISAYLNKEKQQSPVLKGTSYFAQYDEIILEAGDLRDTFVSPTGKPLVSIGKVAGNAYKIGVYGGIMDMNNSDISYKDFSNNIRVRFSQSHYLNISAWQTVIYKRMAVTGLMSLLILIAVILMFYVTFRSMIRQRKVAEIRTDFANNMSHELKTPLSSMGLIVKSLARKNVRSDSKLFDELLVSLERQQHKIQQISDSVLESAMTGDILIEITPVEITHYLNNYMMNYRNETHQLQVEIEQERHILNMNTTILETVLNNLLENAAKYSPDNLTIICNCYAKEEFYHIEITDHGIGVSKQYQPYIFDKFYRVPGAGNISKGLGLGLYLSRRSIIQLGGSLTLKSSSRSGSTFSIQLPIHEN